MFTERHRIFLVKNNCLEYIGMNRNKQNIFLTQNKSSMNFQKCRSEYDGQFSFGSDLKKIEKLPCFLIFL